MLVLEVTFFFNHGDFLICERYLSTSFLSLEISIILSLTSFCKSKVLSIDTEMT